MKFNENLYELTKVLPKYDEELTSEEVSLEEKVFESLINKLSSAQAEDRLIKVRYVSDKWNKNGDSEFELLNYLINNNLFNKIFNQYSIYYEKLSDDLYDSEVSPIVITWDYKRYKEGLNTRSIQSQIATYEVRKNIEICRREEHDFKPWDKYRVIKRFPNENGVCYADKDLSYYSRTCKRCGYVEKTFDNPELVENIRTIEDEVYEYQLLKKDKKSIS